MKTTVDIADELLDQAKRVAAADGITLRALVEAGLRDQLAMRARLDFVLDDASVGGRGTQPGIVEGDWVELRRLIYEGRGE